MCACVCVCVCVLLLIFVVDLEAVTIKFVWYYSTALHASQVSSYRAEVERETA